LSEDRLKQILHVIDQLKRERDIAAQLLTAHIPDLSEAELAVARKAGLIPIIQTITRRRD
jgi:hypothetical protein